MTPETIQNLRRLAKAATPGKRKWMMTRRGAAASELYAEDTGAEILRAFDYTIEFEQRDADLIAACNPATILQLLDEIESRDRKLGMAKAALLELNDCCFDVDRATVPKSGIDSAPPYQVVVNMSVSWTKILNMRAALAEIEK